MPRYAQEDGTECELVAQDDHNSLNTALLALRATSIGRRIVDEWWEVQKRLHVCEGSADQIALQSAVLTHLGRNPERCNELASRFVAEHGEEASQRNGSQAGSGDVTSANEDWVYMCGSNGATDDTGKKIANGVDRTTATGGSTTSQIVVNVGYQTSDFEILEIMTWSRTLTEAEINTMMSHMATLLATGSYATGTGSSISAGVC